MKKRVTAVALSLLLLLPTATVFAETNDQEVNVIGSGLRVNQTKINFKDITLNVKQAQSSSANTSLFVLDGRGTDAGWGISLKANDFIIKKTIDNSEVSFKIPANAITVTTKYKQALVGIPIDFANDRGTTVNVAPLSADTEIPIVSVKPANGAGSHEIAVDYNLSLPKSLAGSNGSNVGVLQGVYTSTFTYTVSAGI